MTEVHLDKFIRQGNDPFRISYKEYASMHDQTCSELSPLYYVQLFKTLVPAPFGFKCTECEKTNLAFIWELNESYGVRWWFCLMYSSKPV